VFLDSDMIVLASIEKRSDDGDAGSLRLAPAMPLELSNNLHRNKRIARDEAVD
jgi:hypothetical protein